LLEIYFKIGFVLSESYRNSKSQGGSNTDSGPKIRVYFNIY
jgi:hypothetical protein